MSSATTQTQSSSPSDLLPSTTSQTQSSTASCSTSSQTPSSSASFSTCWDVFLSFRGEDTRLNFTGHLYQRLHDHGIKTFMDDPELPRGEVISDALLDAIRNSKAYIVVLSPNYASSSWCLDELAEILNCHKTMHRLVIPVFYNIEPTIVRHQTGSFKQAFKKHKDRFVREHWQLSLTEVASFSGHHISKDRSEADAICKIVDELLLKINPKTLYVTKFPVGLDSHVKAITKLLSSDKEGVIRIGIHGMGGVGKTTLAKAVYNENYRSFNGSCFLTDVREASKRENGLISLQQKLVDNVLKSKNERIDNVYQGIELIRARICSKKVLIVIDDLDNIMPLKFIVGPFAMGSIIILTTRNEDLLDSVKVEARYKVNGLDDAESCQLFTQHAFGDNKIPNTFTELSQEILEHAAGLPLALEVFGSNLLNQPEGYWRWFINKLKRVSIEDVENKLIISFQALKSVDPVLQNIYLDIACFFVGHKKKEVVYIMETCYTFVNHHIDILIKRCLLTTNDEDELGMHDLLQDMGRNISRNKSPDEPEKHSRLWISKDICDVLKKLKGTEAVECIIPQDNHQDAFNGLTITTETFQTMSKLRFLHLKKVNITGSFEQIFEDLRLLSWKYCPLRCLPSEFNPPKLVILVLTDSKLRTLWEQNLSLLQVPHVFGNLKTLNMSYSQDLVTTPDFIKLPSLETLNLMGCRSLEEVHMSIGSLVRLKSLNLCGCVKLRSLPDTICNLRALNVLNISDCSSLEALPLQLGNIESLTKLNANGLTVSKLPDTICNLRSLETLSIRKCKKLEMLPDQLWKITRLRELVAGETRLLKKLPDIASSQIALSLQELHLSESAITALPSGFCQLSNLRSLDLSRCSQLLSIPKLPPNLKQIKANYCIALERLPNLSNLKHLETLDLGSCSGLTENHDLGELTALRCLDLRCSSLTRRHLTKRLVKVYSEFGREINVYLSEFLDKKSGPQWSDWILESPYWTSGEISESQDQKSHAQCPSWMFESAYRKDGSSNLQTTTVYAHLLPNESHNFMGIILCFKRLEHCPISNMEIGYSVKNTTSDFVWSMKFGCPNYGLLMVIVPKSIFSVTNNDSIIELTTANVVKIVGIHLLYKTETKTIEDVLRKHVIDIDALKLIDPVLHNIFLDIACFFIGWQKKRVVQILETYYTNVDHHIDILKNRCLLTINARHELEMDELLIHMGKKVEHNNSLEEPEKHSRLWRLTDIYDALKNHKGTEVIEGIVPRKFSYSNIDDALTGESFTLETFNKMRKLRFLYLRKVHLTGSFEQTFQDLRWCPLKCFPSEFYPPKLVILELRHSNFITMWELNMVPHVFEKLKTLDMSGSEDLTTTPDFSKLPCLETLHLEGCKSLEEVHISIGRLMRLVSLNLDGCVKLRSLPGTFCNLRTLEVLDIRNCSCLEALPMALGNIQSLRTLNAGNLTVSILPDSIGHLNKLVDLRLNSNKNLKTLPITICNLRSLEILDISGCEKVEILPDQLCSVTSLRDLIAGGATLLKKNSHVESSQMALSLQKLNFSRSGITALPSSISKLSNLEVLNLEDCHRLLSIPVLPCNLKWIRANGCMSMGRLPNLFNLKQLEYLNLEDCSSLTEIQGLKGLTSIRTLHLKGCNSSLLACLFTESFFQVYSKFGHPIQIYSKEFPDWISQSSEYESARSPDRYYSTMSLNLPSNMSHNYLGIILCITSSDIFTSYYVKNNTNDYIWRAEFDGYGDESLMVIVPRSTFSVEDGDDRIILSAENFANIYGIHLLYKIEENDSTTNNKD